ncbi:LOW QUALITY PROTEIN: hypothetical protein C923_01469 [Plasmodium falciparum UGT5.1]|uniref:Uncharacterized protein n=1 Tax=Plasmodium falciparum UGT5.1 TaxID=1237627 RepID=W7JS08_PLAFA|nr:LOW QUALITY PROTEIN: hypothetical protein C923_01469 [Plasmodium falciparum UGT5.1]
MFKYYYSIKYCIYFFSIHFYNNKPTALAPSARASTFPAYGCLARSKRTLNIPLLKAFFPMILPISHADLIVRPLFITRFVAFLLYVPNILESHLSSMLNIIHIFYNHQLLKHIYDYLYFSLEVLELFFLLLFLYRHLNIGSHLNFFQPSQLFQLSLLINIPKFSKRIKNKKIKNI